MKKYLLKLLLKIAIAASPVFLLLLLYIVNDPFRVIYRYDYSKPVNTPVGLNRDYFSTESFIFNNPTYHYDSFIFGSSRSLCYKQADWRKYIHAVNCFHFDASGETLFGLNKKILFLDKQHIPVKNVLIILDDDLLSKVKNSSGHLYIKDPVLAGDKISFHYEFVSAFFDYNFLSAYIDFLISKKVKPYMTKKHLFSDHSPLTIPQYNEISFSDFDSLITKNPALYYTPERMKVFFKRPLQPEYSSSVIRHEQETMLKQIEVVFKKDSTNVRIVINPLYNQKKFNPTDLDKLNQIFGAQNVFDFSGKNLWTNDFHNYYDESHYRTSIADSILKVIYNGGKALPD